MNILNNFQDSMQLILFSDNFTEILNDEIRGILSNRTNPDNNHLGKSMVKIDYEYAGRLNHIPKAILEVAKANVESRIDDYRTLISVLSPLTILISLLIAIEIDSVQIQSVFSTFIIPIILAALLIFLYLKMGFKYSVVHILKIAIAQSISQ